MHPHKRNEDQIWGWNVKKKVKWHIVHFSMKKLMHRLNASLKEEKLILVELRQRKRRET